MNVRNRLTNIVVTRRTCLKNHFFKCITLAVSFLGLGCLPSFGEEKIIDVNMPSSYVALPFDVDAVKRVPIYGAAYGAATIADGRIRQDSGPEAEVMTAYRTAKGSWAVWVRLPDQTGEFVFSKIGTDDSTRIKVTDDKEHAYGYRVIVQPVKGSTGGPEAAPILIQRAAQLPISGSVKQVSGPKSELMTDKAGVGNVFVKIPNQVCTLVFEAEGKSDRAVIRVWADKDNRCFVSGKKGDDSNPGTEDKPFKTLIRAVKFVKEKPDKKGGVYMAGGEYDLGDEKFTIDYQVSVFGGFDENGWRRDPIITESVLLPHGFCENWVNEVTDRFKDIRRGEPRYHETVILRRTKMKMSTLNLGGGGSPGTLQIAGTPDTYFDGITVYGADENSRGDVTPAFDITGQNKRTVRNCVIIHICGQEHNFITAPIGDGLFENSIVSGGIDSADGNNRPNITGTFGRWKRNLIIGPTGGHYTRIINMWGEGGTFIENQVHGGESTAWTGMQAGHRAAIAERVNVFRKNLFYLDVLFNHCVSAGIVMEDNDFYLFKGGPEGKFMAWKEMTIRNNRFHLAPGIDKEKFWPEGTMKQKFGGSFIFEENDLAKEKYIEPEGVGTGVPIIENNKFTTMEKPDRRAPTLIDLKKLVAQGEKVGLGAFLRPKDPAKNLRAQESEKGTVSLTWEESADADVAGYLIRYGENSNSYQNPTFIGKGKSTEIKNLQPGDWYFTVVPIKEGNVECWKLSNEVQVAVK
jgi:hypothetical protein